MGEEYEGGVWSQLGVRGRSLETIGSAREEFGDNWSSTVQEGTRGHPGQNEVGTIWN